MSSEALAAYVTCLRQKSLFPSDEQAEHISADHIGIDLADAVLQRQLKWDKSVRPRLERISNTYPTSRTISGLREVLRTVPVSEFLKWRESKSDRGWCRVTVFRALVELCIEEKIETESDLKTWLLNEDNRQKIQAIHQVSDKTIDYLKVRVGIPAVAIDVHLTRFLEEAGNATKGMSYGERRKIIERAADHLGVSRSIFDYNIWRYMTAQREGAGTRCMVNQVETA